MNRRQLLLLTLTIFLASSFLFALSPLIAELPTIGPIGSSLIRAIAGTLFGIAVVGLVNEYFLAEDLLKKFSLLGDQRTTGIQRVLTESETYSYIANSFSRAREVYAVGLGFRWLLEERRMRELLLNRIERGCSIRLLLPNPTSNEIKQRVVRDQEGLQQLGLAGFESNIELVRQIVQESGSPSNLEVRVYCSYPACSIIIIDDNLLVTPYLAGSLGVDNSTLLFKGLTATTEPFYRHLETISKSSAHSISLTEYLKNR